jgi:thiaminase
MSDTLQWVEQIRSDLRPLEDKVMGHSYLKALDEGRLQRDQLKVFALQQHHIISSDLRSIALIVSRQGDATQSSFPDERVARGSGSAGCTACVR